MIETRALHSSTGNVGDESKSLASRMPVHLGRHLDAASSIHGFDLSRISTEDLSFLERISTGTSYATGAFSQSVPDAVKALKSATSHAPNEVFVLSGTRSAGANVIEALVQDRQFTALFESSQDLLQFASMLQQYPGLLVRTRSLVAQTHTSEHAESVSIEVDDEEGCVLVWVRLNVADAERLEVKMRLFEEGQRVLGDLADVVRLAMI